MPALPLPLHLPVADAGVYCGRHVAGGPPAALQHDSLLWQPKRPHLLRQHCLHQWRGWSPRLHPPPDTLPLCGVAQPGPGSAHLLLPGHGHLPQDLAAVCLPPLHLVAGGCHHSCQPLLLQSHEGVWQEQRGHFGHPLPALLQQAAQDHHHCAQLQQCLGEPGRWQWRRRRRGGEIQFQPHKVWTYDGNVIFLEKKHAILFAVSLLFLVLLFLPYTLLLTFGQCLRSAPLQRRWVRRLVQSTAFVSILDAYHAPYQRRHRYWTGIMLLTRCGLFLAFATFQSDISVPANMFVTSLTVSTILLYKSLASKVYKHLFVNLLELCFLINLGILSAILLYVKDSSPTGGDVMCKATSASISISLLVFLGILAHHGYLRVSTTRHYLALKLACLKKMHQMALKFRLAKDSAEFPKDARKECHVGPTSTFVELREELLASNSAD